MSPRYVYVKRKGANALRVPVLNPRARAYSAARAMKRRGERDFVICHALGIARDRLPTILDPWGGKLRA